MGRTFENRRISMLKRGARDAKAFTRCARQISIAVKAGGTDPDANSALRRAIQNARGANMPKDKIQNAIDGTYVDQDVHRLWAPFFVTAIDKASGAGGGEGYEEVLYEGYGPHGIAMIVETTTDNPTRTVANVRFAFKKGGGSMGASGSVMFMFDKFGFFKVRPEGFDREAMELELIDDGLEEMLDGIDDKGDPVVVLRCAHDDFGNLQSGLDQRNIEPIESGFEWVPQTSTELGDEEAEAVMALIERLEDDDDVQRVYHNLE